MNAKAARLLDRLKGELRSPRAIGQPIIIEDYLFDNSLRIYVIWDKWKSMTKHQCNQVIFEAYKQHYEMYPQKEKVVSITHALIVRDAITGGILPIRIEPYKYKCSQADPTPLEYTNAMMNLEASAIPGFQWPQLRFLKQEEAETAIEYLQQLLPRSRWLLIIEK